MRPHSGVSDEMGVRMTLSKWRRFAGLFALMAALTFAIAACGGGDDEGAGATTEAGGGTAEKTFPEFKIAFDNGELKVTGAYKEPLSFKSGTVGLKVTKKGEKGDDFEFETDKFIILPWDKEVIEDGQLVTRPDYARYLQSSR